MSGRGSRGRPFLAPRIREAADEVGDVPVECSMRSKALAAARLFLAPPLIAHFVHQ